MKWEYLQIRLSDDYTTWIAFDGHSECDGDKFLIKLLNRLGQDRWEYCLSIGKKRHYLKRSLP